MARDLVFIPISVSLPPFLRGEFTLKLKSKQPQKHFQIQSHGVYPGIWRESPRFLTTAGFMFRASIHTRDCYRTPVCHSEVHPAQANNILKLH